MREVRARIPPEDRARLAEAIEERLFDLAEMAAARTVLLFYSFGSEVATRSMARRVLSARKHLLLPYLDGDAMEAAEVRSGEDLIPTSYGPREPPRRVSADPAEVDLVVTPGLAFDRHGHRLGYGGGHYDRYLARLRSETIRVGIGFGAQLVDEVPHGPGDQRVHLVVTENDVVDCRD